MPELNRLDAKSALEQDKTPLVLVLENVRSALNVGSAFRTADAFAIEKIVLCGISAQPPHREILKTALGSTETVAWEYFEKIEDALNMLSQNDYSIHSVELAEGSVPLHLFIPVSGKKYALIFGNEVEGVSDEALALSDGAIEIPQFGAKHSLNIAVCVGIVSWELVKKMKGLNNT